MHVLEQKIFYLFQFIPLSPGAVLPWVITLAFGYVCWRFGRKIAHDSQEVSQYWLEYIYESLEDLVCTIVGEHLKKQLLPVLATCFIYVFSSNLLGLVPGLKSPTSLFSNCLGMALIVFVYTFYLGIKAHGIGYIKHFTGDIWWMAPLMLPIHIVGEISRPISLTLRLFGNIMGEDTVILVLTVALFPLLVPVPMLLMAIFTSMLQALVFTILTGVYLSGAISEGH
ncbi:MAG: ATP synthase F0 subunit A [Candidatus Riflebacteria bacterium HGW-Riflebacteria-2]|jgi:F-type H+-transporting ATPase subunit a|nr:MAG: ATP synthase F0 subunit A [Candidatus Riflebacteria bacterium HGW-Riflebacteria-2]